MTQPRFETTGAFHALNTPAPRPQVPVVEGIPGEHWHLVGTASCVGKSVASSPVQIQLAGATPASVATVTQAVIIYWFWELKLPDEFVPYVRPEGLDPAFDA